MHAIAPVNSCSYPRQRYSQKHKSDRAQDADLGIRRGIEDGQVMALCVRMGVAQELPRSWPAKALRTV